MVTGQIESCIRYVSLCMYVCMYVWMDMKVYPCKSSLEAKEYQTCQPLIKENLETHEEKCGDSTKSIEILIFFRSRLSKCLLRWEN